MIKKVAAAFQFLTILPIPVRTNTQDLGGSLVWFPLVGAVLGLGLGYGYVGLVLVFPPAVASALTIGLYILYTRGLHLDGFMDTIDGFCSGRDRQRILQIMKEPCLGSFAALGIGLWFLVLWSALPHLTPVDFVFIHTVTRFQVLIPPLLCAYPRESGTGQFFVQQKRPTTLFGAILIVSLVAAGLYSLQVQGTRPLIIYGLGIALAIASALACSYWAYRKIGGVTGDVLGFSIETAHLLLALWLLATPVILKYP